MMDEITSSAPAEMTEEIEGLEDLEELTELENFAELDEASVPDGIPVNLDLKKILEDMARAIVDNPDSVSVTEENKEDEIVLTLHVAEDDMGMIIGKHGKIARALRTVTKAAAKMADQKIVVEIK